MSEGTNDFLDKLEKEAEKVAKNLEKKKKGEPTEEDDDEPKKVIREVSNIKDLLGVLSEGAGLMQKARDQDIMVSSTHMAAVCILKAMREFGVEEVEHILSEKCKHIPKGWNEEVWDGMLDAIELADKGFEKSDPDKFE